MSPEPVSGSEVAWTIGGWKLSWEWKFCVGVPPAARASLDEGAEGARSEAAFAGIVAGTAIRKENSSRVAPGAPEAVPARAELSRALTWTSSPAANGLSGANAVPACAGSRLRWPACSPVVLPRTTTDLSSDGTSAEKMTVESAPTSGVPGNGITRSVLWDTPTDGPAMADDGPADPLAERASAGAAAAAIPAAASSASP